MGLTPVGAHELTVQVDGEEVSVEEITDDGVLEIQPSISVAGIAGRESGSRTPFWNDEGTVTVFNFSEERTVEVDYSTGVTELYDDPYINGNEVTITADGEEITSNTGTSGGTYTTSGSTTVDCQRMRVYWDTGDNDTSGGPAVEWDIDWDASEDFADDVELDLSADDVQLHSG